VPDRVHVTPLLLESLLTVAAKPSVCPSSMLVWDAGVTETEIAGGVLLPPPQAYKNKNPDKMDKIDIVRFMAMHFPVRPQSLGFIRARKAPGVERESILKTGPK